MCWALFKALCEYCSEQMEINPYTHGVGWGENVQHKSQTESNARVYQNF